MEYLLEGGCFDEAESMDIGKLSDKQLAIEIGGYEVRIHNHEEKLGEG